MDKKSKKVGAALLGAGAVGAAAKATGAFKAIGLAVAGFFSHGGAADAAVLAPTVSRAATEVSALAPAAREAPVLAPAVSRAAVQVLTRIPGHEREQLASLAGEARDRFLVLICREEVSFAGLRTFVTGPFRDWAAPTAEAFGRLGLPRARDILDEARTLPKASSRWPALDAEFRDLLQNNP